MWKFFVFVIAVLLLMGLLSSPNNSPSPSTSVPTTDLASRSVKPTNPATFKGGIVPDAANAKPRQEAMNHNAQAAVGDAQGLVVSEEAVDRNCLIGAEYQGFTPPRVGFLPDGGPVILRADVWRTKPGANGTDENDDSIPGDWYVLFLMFENRQDAQRLLPVFDGNKYFTGPDSWTRNKGAPMPAGIQGAVSWMSWLTASKMPAPGNEVSYAQAAAGFASQCLRQSWKANYIGLWVPNGAQSLPTP